MKYFFGISIFILLFQQANAEVVTCTAEGKSKIKSLQLKRMQQGRSVQWLIGDIDFGAFSKNQKVNLIDSPRGTKLMYLDTEFSGNFTLDLGNYHGQGKYPNSKLNYINRNGWSGPEKIATQVTCVLSGTMDFKNYCERSTNNDPEQNLLKAARNQNVRAVLGTLACDVDASVKDSKGCSSILLAADRNCGTGVFDVYAAGAYTNEIIMPLLDSGAMAEEEDPITKERLLHKLVRNQDIKAISSLIPLEVDLNAADAEGFTPLMRAVETASYLVVDAIASAGADLNVKNQAGQTARDIAMAKRFDFLLPYLQEATNFEITTTSDGKCSPLNFEAKSGKAIKVTLKNQSPKMFMVTSSSINLSIMVDGNSTKSQRLPKLNAGEYAFKCGIHGGKEYDGKIVIK